MLTKDKYDIIVLFSGGADSRLMLELANDLSLNPCCLLIDYGQKHIEELNFAKKQLNELSIDYQVVKIDGLNISSALTSGEGSLYEGVSPWHVPGRNLMFLSIAYSIAETYDVPEIWYGPDYSDRIGLFPDCYQDWVFKVDELFKINGSKKINLKAPLLGFTKDMVLKLLRDKYKVKEEEMFSGYGDLKV